MYLAKMNCVSCNRQPARGLGFWEAIAGAVASSFLKDDAPAPSGAPVPGMQAPAPAPQIPVTVSTQVSPQISPVFQQSHGSSGGQTAGTSQTAPASFPAPAQYDPAGMPVLPGTFPEPIPGGLSPALPNLSPYYTAKPAMPEYMPALLIGGIGIAAVMFFSRKKGA